MSKTRPKRIYRIYKGHFNRRSDMWHDINAGISREDFQKKYKFEDNITNDKLCTFRATLRSVFTTIISNEMRSFYSLTDDEPVKQYIIDTVNQLGFNKSDAKDKNWNVKLGEAYDALKKEQASAMRGAIIPSSIAYVVPFLLIPPPKMLRAAEHSTPTIPKLTELDAACVLFSMGKSRTELVGSAVLPPTSHVVSVTTSRPLHNGLG